MATNTQATGTIKDRQVKERINRLEIVINQVHTLTDQVPKTKDWHQARTLANKASFRAKKALDLSYDMGIGVLIDKAKQACEGAAAILTYAENRDNFS